MKEEPKQMLVQTMLVRANSNSHSHRKQRNASSLSQNSIASYTFSVLFYAFMSCIHNEHGVLYVLHM